MTTQHLTFQVRGQDLVQIARDVFFERTWEAALHMLQESLDGLGVDTAIEILTGRKTLTGVNDLELVDETPEVRQEWEQRLADMLCGFAKLKDHWFRPYGYTDCFTGADVYNGEFTNRWIQAPDHGGGGRVPRIFGERESMGRWGAYRSLYYARRPADDLLTYADIDGRAMGVLWEQVLSPPFWLWPKRATPIGKVHGVSWLGGPEAADFQSALEEFLTQRRLRHMTPPPEKFATPRTDNPETGAMCRPEPEDITIERLPDHGILAELTQEMISRGCDADVVAGTLAAVTGRQDQTSKPEQADVRDSQSGYILPGGAFYACAYMEHRALGRRIFLWQEQREVEDPEKLAEKRGWIRLQKSATGGINIDCPRHPTDAQEMVLIEFKVAHGLELGDGQEDGSL